MTYVKAAANVRAVYRSLPRTAIIGAGISGLTAGKMLEDYGVPYTTFETSDRIGGNWAFGNPNGHSSAYRSLHIAFIGFAQSVPTLFPFVECQSRLLAAYAVGRYALPSQAEMERVIDADQRTYTGHYTESARHTQQVDYFHYEHDLRTRELRAGLERANRVTPV